MAGRLITHGIAKLMREDLAIFGKRTQKAK